MFPANWIPYVGTVPAGPSPCPEDIVGKNNFTSNYALFWGLDSTDISFRMRLNGDPRKNEPNQDELESHVWGVQIVDALNEVQFIVRVDGKNANELQIYLPSDYTTPIYSEPIVVGTNVIVTEVSPKLYGRCGTYTTSDYLLDFKLPIIEFTDFNFSTDIFKLCYFTGSSNNTGLPDNFTEEPICGPFINGQGFDLDVTKTIISGNTIINVGETETWVLQIKVKNTSSEAITNVVVTDVLNSNLSLVDADPAPDSLNPLTWTFTELAPNEEITILLTVSGSFSTVGHEILDQGTASATNIPEKDFEDPGVDVIPPPIRGLNYLDLFKK